MCYNFQLKRCSWPGKCRKFKTCDSLPAGKKENMKESNKRRSGIAKSQQGAS